MSIPENPVTRKEMYLAKIAGQDVDVPTAPATRVEMYLAEIAKNSGAGSSVDLSGYVQKNDVTSIMSDYGINSKTQIPEMNTAIDDKLSKSSIVKLDSMADFESITNKTAEWYFIKEG